MMRGRPSKYVHLLRAMRAGDVLYLVATAPRFDRHISGTVFKLGGKCETANFVAVLNDAATAHHILKITMLQPLKS